MALRDAVPTIGPFRGYAAAGGLMSYGGSVTESGQLHWPHSQWRATRDLPVLQITKIELVINLKTAKALGLSVPLPLLGRSDEMIE